MRRGQTWGRAVRGGAARIGASLFALVALVSAGSVVVAPTTSVTASVSIPSYDHVFVMLFENHAYSQVIGSSSAPYLNSLAASGALATNYFATDHPSLPNYLELTSGTNAGINYDCTPPSTCPDAAPNLADSLDHAGLSWKAYAESAPSACPQADSGTYATKHEPFVYYNDIRTNSARCQAHVVPMTQLQADLASATTTPAFAFLTPNLCDDMHDCSVSTGDNWASQHIPAIVGSPAFTQQRSLLMVVWDENDGSAGNQVPAMFVGAGVRPGTRDGTRYTHYSLLRTVEDVFGLPTLTGSDAGAGDMAGMFSAVTPTPSTTPGPSAPPTGVSGIADGGGTVTATWSSPTDDGGSPITYYAVYTYPQLPVDPIRVVSSPSLVVSGLQDGSYCTFTVSAWNGVAWSPWSAWAPWASV